MDADWQADLERWLDPFLKGLGNKTRQRMTQRRQRFAQPCRQPLERIEAVGIIRFLDHVLQLPPNQAGNADDAFALIEAESLITRSLAIDRGRREVEGGQHHALIEMQV